MKITPVEFTPEFIDGLVYRGRAEFWSDTKEPDAIIGFRGPNFKTGHELRRWNRTISGRGYWISGSPTCIEVMRSIAVRARLIDEVGMDEVLRRDIEAEERVAVEEARKVEELRPVIEAADRVGDALRALALAIVTASRGERAE